MKKKILLRGLLGIPTGIAIGYVITIGISLIWGKGYYAPCVPELISLMGSEIRAVILQTALCGLLGVGCSASSVIWELGGLEPGQADRPLFSDSFGHHDAHCVFYVLDGSTAWRDSSDISGFLF